MGWGWSMYRAEHSAVQQRAESREHAAERGPVCPLSFLLALSLATAVKLARAEELAQLTDGHEKAKQGKQEHVLMCVCTCTCMLT